MIFFISGPEILFVGLIVLLVFGADKQGIDTESIKKEIDDVKGKMDDLGGSIKRNF